MRRLLERSRSASALVILLVLVAAFSVASGQFLSADNLVTVALQTSILAIVAIGMTFTIITGGIDLSVGSVVALAGAVAAGLATRQGLSTPLAIGAGLLVGMVVGAASGMLVAFGRLPPFVATLATMAIARGLTLVYTQGRPIAGLSASFIFLGSGNLGGIPVPVFVLVLVAVIAYVLLAQTPFGLHLYAIGGGEETARLAGISVNREKILVYVISGFCSGLAGIILTGRLWSAQPNAGVLMELDAIASAVLGGTSLAGGTGGILGTLAGSFIIGVLSNGLNLLAVPSYTQQVVKGLVFILAVVLDYFLRERWVSKPHSHAEPQENS